MKGPTDRWNFKKLQRGRGEWPGIGIKQPNDVFAGGITAQGDR